MEERPSKREVSRAGQHLAARLQLVRDGERDAMVDATDSGDVRARQVVEWWRLEHVVPMLTVSDAIGAMAPALELGDGDSLIAVSARSKRLDAMIDKLLREPGKLVDMADIGGVRAVLNDQDECDALASQLQKSLDVRRVRDWARHPRSTGYRAIHLHVREGDRTIEIQLRTFSQDGWANLVEEESRLSGVNYKAGAGDADVLTFFATVADSFATMELGEVHPNIAQRLYDDLQRARRKLRSPMLKEIKP